MSPNVVLILKLKKTLKPSKEGLQRFYCFYDQCLNSKYK